VSAVTTSKTGYWIGGGLMAAGAAGIVVWLALGIGGIFDTVRDFQRVSPGEAVTLNLEARKYVIYAEGPNADIAIPRGSVSIRDATDEQELDTRVYESSLTYDWAGHTGAAILTVTPPHPGRYDVSVAGGDGGNNDPFSSDLEGVAIGESVGGRIAKTVLIAFLIGALVILPGIAILATTIVRRANARRRAAPPPAFAVAAGPPPAGFAPPGYGPPPWGAPGSPPADPGTDPPPPDPDAWRGA
jgi:hypothetical protein